MKALRPGMDPFATVDRLSERLGIPAAELDEADRLLRVARIVEVADRVFGSGDKANRWLRTAQPMWNDVCPLALLDSDAGAQSVSDELTRIEFGDFA